VRLAMGLALRLGRTLAELGETMTSEEFDLWLELHRSNGPWDDTRGDVHAGIIAATIANYAGMSRKQGAPLASPFDFMPFAKRQDEEESEPDPVAYFKAIKAAMDEKANAQAKRKK
jgi:hypothetical protein